MARIGITYIDVENAAQQLQGRGKNPTVDNIRELLGTGSKSTIAQHLRAWKGQQMTSDPSILPQELLSLVTGLWEKLNGAADERIINIEHAARLEIEKMSTSLDSVRQELSQLSHQKTAFEEAIYLKDQTISQLTNDLLDEKQKKESLLIQQEAQSNQLSEMKSENERLHQLASHIQANLEHYQAAMQKLQIEQNLMLEKQQVFFQEQLNALETEIKEHRQKLMLSDQTLQLSQIELTQLREQLTENKEKLKSTTAEVAQTKDWLAKKESQLEIEHKNTIKLQDELTITKEKYQTIYTEKAIVSDQLKRSEILLQQKEDALELVRQEKLFLLQENAEMKGYLKTIDLKRKNLVHAE